MKAIRTARSHSAEAFSLLLLMLATSCTAPAVAPRKAAVSAAPAPGIVAPQAFAPAPPRAAAPDWRDAPLTPGTWTWTREGSTTVARFADGLLALVCNPAAGMVSLLRQGSGSSLPSGEVPMTIVTSTMVRPVSGSAIAGMPPAVAATFAPRDALLDAMAFSRGRFAVETAGLPTLYVPSWAEVGRVVEDCR
jgi:hypothetical protein